jgi:hypothetical protein
MDDGQEIRNEIAKAWTNAKNIIVLPVAHKKLIGHNS